MALEYNLVDPRGAKLSPTGAKLSPRGAKVGQDGAKVVQDGAKCDFRGPRTRGPWHFASVDPLVKSIIGPQNHDFV